MAEELTAPMGLTAGTVMHMAASAQQQTNKQTLQAGHGMNTDLEAAQAAMIEASTAVSEAQLLEQARAANKRWEESRSRLISTLGMQEATGCPNWQRERPKSAKLVVAAAKAAQRELSGYGMATSQPCTMNSGRVAISLLHKFLQVRSQPHGALQPPVWASTHQVAHDCMP